MSEYAISIANQLTHLDDRIDKTAAIKQIKRIIAKLRVAFKQQRGSNPKELKKVIGRAASHASGLWKGMHSLPADVRDQLDFYFEHGETSETVKTWMDNLQLVANVLDLQAKVPHRPSRFQLECANAAIGLICELVPAINPADLSKTATSPFYMITGYLWSAVSGRRDVDVKRPCDATIDSWKNGQAEYDGTVITSVDLIKNS